ncbi:MAG: hypothetical protein ACP5OA_01755 [Candidatus Woesearchaeota archaeon]
MNLRNIGLIVGIVLLISMIGVIAVINTGDDTAMIDETLATDNISQGNDMISSDPNIVNTDISMESTHVVERQDSCVDEKYVESVPRYDACFYDVDVCDDEPLNTSCHKVEREDICYVGSVDVEKIRKNCHTSGYKISKYVLDTEEYVCNVDVSDKESTIVLCDSKYDGNGDGICTSGESCMKYVIDQDSIEQYEKNSRDEFVQSDDSYFLNKINTEVVQ